MANPEFFRHNETIKKYNATALKALDGTDTVINDLWQITESAPKSYHSDWVHYYTPEGTELIGDKVIQVICTALKITRNEIDTESFEGEKYSKQNIGM